RIVHQQTGLAVFSECSQVRPVIQLQRFIAETEVAREDGEFVAELVVPVHVEGYGCFRVVAFHRDACSLFWHASGGSKKEKPPQHSGRVFYLYRETFRSELLLRTSNAFGVLSTEASLPRLLDSLPSHS